MLIVSNISYSISVDVEVNRLYITLKGFWIDPSQTPDYAKHIKLATEYLNSPFTALVDVREMRTPGHLVKDMHVEAQRATIAAGLVKNRFCEQALSLYICSRSLSRKTVSRLF